MQINYLNEQHPFQKFHRGLLSIFMQSLIMFSCCLCRQILWPARPRQWRWFVLPASKSLSSLHMHSLCPLKTAKLSAHITPTCSTMSFLIQPVHFLLQYVLILEGNSDDSFSCETFAGYKPRQMEQPPQSMEYLMTVPDMAAFQI